MALLNCETAPEINNLESPNSNLKVGSLGELTCSARIQIIYTRRSHFPPTDQPTETDLFTGRP